ncbi:hypothetical protein VCUG_00969 [Vavraia culicis subsp. floridensis]|uniref:AAA+ ATPase domain-containing protein n=1 Tax=Vavraia culicis (isolate floridensis) TaxID=948595 RepID=L2GW65_VAVCU|nr:uncharacterized protein VCUG_00969 [Vavraia culicis subsp. floridensis]ELA47538.1 hypothetical protein VCUG_00969 [Vavraia culicis subsp. floridensis]
MSYSLYYSVGRDKYITYVGIEELEGSIRIGDVYAYAEYSPQVCSPGTIVVSRLYTAKIGNEHKVDVQKADLSRAGIVYYSGKVDGLKTVRVIKTGTRVDNGQVLRIYKRRECLCVPLPYYWQNGTDNIMDESVAEIFDNCYENRHKDACISKEKARNVEEKENIGEKGNDCSGGCDGDTGEGHGNGNDCTSDTNNMQSMHCGEMESGDSAVTCDRFSSQKDGQHLNDVIQKNNIGEKDSKDEEEHSVRDQEDESAAANILTEEDEYFVIDDQTVFINVGNKSFTKKIYANISLLLKTYARAFNSLYFPTKLKRLGIDPIDKIVLSGEIGTGKRTFCMIMNDFLNTNMKIETYRRAFSIRTGEDEANILDECGLCMEKTKEMSFFIVNDSHLFNFYRLGNVCAMKLDRPGKRVIQRILGDYGLNIVNDVLGMNYYEIFNLISEYRVYGNRMCTEKEQATFINGGEGLRLNRSLPVDKRHDNARVDVSDKCSENSTDGESVLTDRLQDLSLSNRSTSAINDYLTRINRRTKRDEQLNFKNIAGYQKVKDIVAECLTRTHTDLIDYPTGILLYGPPGCSKTLLARSLSSTFNYNFVYFSGSSIKSKWVGESERNLCDKFREAELIQPSLLFIDEIDAIACNRDTSYNHEISLVNTLLSLMDGIDKRQTIVFGSTNRRSGIDKALLRPGRFDRHIYIGLPDECDRKEIIKLYLHKKYDSDTNCSIDSGVIESGTAHSNGTSNVLVKRSSKDDRIDSTVSECTVGGSSLYSSAGDLKSISKANDVIMISNSEVKDEEQKGVVKGKGGSKCRICLSPSPTNTFCYVKWNVLVRSTEGMSGAELKAAVNEGKMLFAKRYRSSECAGMNWTSFILKGVQIIKEYKE